MEQETRKGENMKLLPLAVLTISLVTMGYFFGYTVTRYNNAIATDQLINCLAGLPVCGLTTAERSANTQKILRRMEEGK